MSVSTSCLPVSRQILLLLLLAAKLIMINRFFFCFRGKNNEKVKQIPVTWCTDRISLCVFLSRGKFMPLHVPFLFFFSPLLAGVFGSVAWHGRTEEPFSGFT